MTEEELRLHPGDFQELLDIIAEHRTFEVVDGGRVVDAIRDEPGMVEKICERFGTKPYVGYRVVVDYSLKPTGRQPLL